jgi:FMN phosphatase YigB (HAD superfamily)
MVKIICSDCNGVLEHIAHNYSKSGYYVIKNGNNEKSSKITKIIYESKYLINSWMVNEITFEEINKILSIRLGIDEEYLNNLLVKSIKEFEWNWELINIYQKNRQNGIKVIMTTDNMDIFTKIAVPENNFNDYFDKIYNSSDLKCLKAENNLKLFFDICNEYKINPNEMLIIDDNKTFIEKAIELGYRTYLYNMETKNNFEEWFDKNVKI